MASYDFQVMFASHASNGKCYVVDAFLQINDENGEEIDNVACDCVIEDCDAPNTFTFYTSDNGNFTLNCKWEIGENGYGDFKYEVLKDGEKVEEDDFTVSENRYKADEDDDIWRVLGYENENDSEDEDEDE